MDIGYKFEVMLPPDYNSSPESVYSLQGYETAIVRDYSSGSLSSFSDANDLVGDQFDSVYYSDNEAYYLSEVGNVAEILSGEDHYAIEYDITSIASSKKSNDDSSSGGNDVEENYVALLGLHCVYDAEDTDLEFWADSSNCEDSSTDDCDPDITDSDKWQCQHCKNLNWPTMRFCQKCWKVRKNWLPQQRRRPPKRLRRKRSKLEFDVSSKRRRLNYATRQRAETMSSNDEFISNTDAALKLKSLQGQLAASSEVAVLSYCIESPSDSVLSQEKVAVCEAVTSDGCNKLTADCAISCRELVDTPSEVNTSISCAQSTTDSKLLPPQDHPASEINGSGGRHQSTADKGLFSSREEHFMSEVSTSIDCNQATTDTSLPSSLEQVDAFKFNTSVSCSLSQSTVDNSLSSSQEQVSSSKDSTLTSNSKFTTVGSPSPPFKLQQVAAPVVAASDSGLSSQEPVASPVASVIGNDSPNALQVKQAFVSNASSEANLCLLCVTRTKNACISHGRIGHFLTCYKCAQKLFQNEQPCPFCRRYIKEVTRILEIS